jgi:enamidase
MESNWGYKSMSVETARAIVDTAHKRGKRASVHVSLCRDAALAIQTGTDSLAHMVIDELSPELAKRIAETGIIWVPTIEVWKGFNLGDLVVPNLRTFVAAGGRVAMGTDFAGGPFAMEMGMPAKELQWMQEAGMTPMQIIVAATRNAAEACGLIAETGTIETEKAADLLVVEGDPLSSLDALTHVRWVIHSGTVIRKP